VSLYQEFACKCCKILLWIWKQRCCKTLPSWRVVFLSAIT
jgi:hypothetical protein